MTTEVVLKWSDVGEHRAKDASVLHTNGQQLCALYLIGYFVECQAKALCFACGRKPPLSGANGHDLALLIILAGHRPSDLPANHRHFAQTRRVDLRYESALDDETDYQAMYAAAGELGAWLRRRALRVLRTGRRR
jgi:hypothetical protein